MAQKLAELYSALVRFGIPPEECVNFILSLVGDSNKDHYIRQAFLVKHKTQIEAGSFVFAEGLTK